MSQVFYGGKASPDDIFQSEEYTNLIKDLKSNDRKLTNIPLSTIQDLAIRLGTMNKKDLTEYLDTIHENNPDDPLITGRMMFDLYLAMESLEDHAKHDDFKLGSNREDRVTPVIMKLTRSVKSLIQGLPQRHTQYYYNTKDDKVTTGNENQVNSMFNAKFGKIFNDSENPKFKMLSNGNALVTVNYNRDLRGDKSKTSGSSITYYLKKEKDKYQQPTVEVYVAKTDEDGNLKEAKGATTKNGFQSKTRPVAVFPADEFDFSKFNFDQFYDDENKLNFPYRNEVISRKAAEQDRRKNKEDEDADKKVKVSSDQLSKEDILTGRAEEQDRIKSSEERNRLKFIQDLTEQLKGYGPFAGAAYGLMEKRYSNAAGKGMHPAEVETSLDRRLFNSLIPKFERKSLKELADTIGWSPEDTHNLLHADPAARFVVVDAGEKGPTIVSSGDQKWLNAYPTILRSKNEILDEGFNELRGKYSKTVQDLMNKGGYSHPSEIPEKDLKDALEKVDIKFKRYLPDIKRLIQGQFINVGNSRSSGKIESVRSKKLLPYEMMRLNQAINLAGKKAEARKYLEWYSQLPDEERQKLISGEFSGEIKTRDTANRFLNAITNVKNPDNSPMSEIRPSERRDPNPKPEEKQDNKSEQKTTEETVSPDVDTSDLSQLHQDATKAVNTKAEESKNKREGKESAITKNIQQMQDKNDALLKARAATEELNETKNDRAFNIDPYLNDQVVLDENGDVIAEANTDDVRDATKKLVFEKNFTLTPAGTRRIIEGLNAFTPGQKDEEEK